MSLVLGEPGDSYFLGIENDYLTSKYEGDFIFGPSTQYEITSYYSNHGISYAFKITIRKLATGSGQQFLVYIDYNGYVFKTRESYSTRDASEVMKQMKKHLETRSNYSRPCDVSNFIHDKFDLVML
jgi:hypothetical protein